MERYKFYRTKNQVICVSHYAGKAVRGIAKCAPSDEFDEEFGKKLAQLRCDLKVAQKRYMRAIDKLNDADEACAIAEEHVHKMENYLWDAESELDNAAGALLDFMNEAEPRSDAD